MSKQNQPSEEEINYMIVQGEAFVREIRKMTQARLHKLIHAYANKYGLESDAAIEANFKISPLVHDTDTQRLFFMNEQIALVDWVEGEIYQISSEDDV
ncbi:hypothetical protein GWN26_04150 [Candidatus Saccharibacteria bacterium]|nr:hypothetical protein [Candidatus Saccharibacteria bacterium]NIW78662.1 hypothetical protein [Calditrichia bacterium]